MQFECAMWAAAGEAAPSGLHPTDAEAGRLLRKRPKIQKRKQKSSTNGFLRHKREPGGWQCFSAPLSSLTLSSTAYALDSQGLSRRHGQDP